MPADEPSKSDNQSYQKVSLKEFFAVSKWSLTFFFKIQPFYTTVYLVSSVISSVKDLVNTFIFAKVLDLAISTASSGQPISTLYPYFAVIVVYNLFETATSYVSSICQSTIRNLSRPRVRQAIYTKLKELGIQTLEIPEVNDRIHRSSDYLGVVIPFVDGLVNLIVVAIRLVTSTIIVITIIPIFVPIVVVASVPYLLFDKAQRSKIYKFDFDTTEQQRIAGGSAGDLTALNRLAEIYITGAFNYLDNKYIEFQKWAAKNRLQIVTQWIRGSHTMGVVTDTIGIIGYIKLFSNLVSGAITVGALSFGIRTIDMFQSSVSRLIRTFNDQFELAIQVKDVYLLFRTQPAFTDGTIELPKLEAAPKIELKNVSFCYPRAAKPIFEDFNLTIEPGEKIAVVGHNGAGKTTLVRLICRLYQASAGKVMINSFNINDLKIDTWYRNIGVLFQEFNSYTNLTAKENILIGNTQDPENLDKIVESAKNADALQFIENYPQQFNTLLSEKFKGGTRPSSGQWQKLAIARFFYRNTPVIIFDEPTASIDAISEYNIFNKIYEHFIGKTVIIISHRFSTVRNADRIIVVDAGKIVESGTHDELMKNDGYYAKSFNLQAHGYSEKLY